MTDHSHMSMRRILLKESLKKEFERFGITEAQLNTAIAPPLPQDFSIRDEMTPVKNQGFSGSCSSFSVVPCLEHIHRRVFSEGQVQHESEKSYDDCSEGLRLVHAFETCKSKGAVDESVWPYDEQQVCWKKPPSVKGKRRYKFNSYKYVYLQGRNKIKGKSRKGFSKTLAIRRQLFGRRKAISASVPVFDEAWPWKGSVTMPSPMSLRSFFKNFSTPKDDGWHAITICGWSDSSGRFIFKNSWGTHWGDDGYGTIPYQYIEAYSDLAVVGW